MILDVARFWAMRILLDAEELCQGLWGSRLRVGLVPRQPRQHDFTAPLGVAASLLRLYRTTFYGAISSLVHSSTQATNMYKQATQKTSEVLSLPPKWLGMYSDFITKNSSAVSQIESALRSLTYIIPGTYWPHRVK